MQRILSATLLLPFGICAIVSQDVMWSHICPHEIKILTCPLGTTVEVTGIFLASRKLGCPDNRTDPVYNLPDCFSPQTGDVFITVNMNNGTDCNGSNVCAVHPPAPTEFIACSKFILANFTLVSYKCHPAGTTTSPESSSPTTPTGNTDGNATSNSPVTSPVTPTAAVLKSGFPDYLTIPLAAGIGGAVLIVIVIFLVIFCKRRKSRDESIESPKKRKESVAELNINKVGTQRKRTAPRIKVADPPDVTADTSLADEETEVNYSQSDLMGLYAVPDKSGLSENLANGKNDNVTLDPVYSQVHKKPKTDTKATIGETSFSETADPPKIYHNTSSKDLPLHEADNDANERIEDGLDNIGFVGDSGQYAEIPFGLQQQPDSADSEQRRVRFGGEEEIVGKGRESPDGLSDVDDGATRRNKTATNDEKSRKKVPSVVYAEVNKTPPS